MAKEGVVLGHVRFALLSSLVYYYISEAGGIEESTES